MRLWDKRLIDVLPREQLVAQWRELSAIAGNILKKGTPNHILVNQIMDYSFDHFLSYVSFVRGIMTERGYRTTDKVWDKITSVKADYKENSFQLQPFDTLYSGWMDNEYFMICYYNLKEKWLRGGIKDEDWNKIKKRREALGIYELYS